MSTEQLRSAGISVAIHAIILILLMFLYISSPIPPWEEGLAGGGGGGSFVEFGTLDVTEAPPPPPRPEPVEEIKKETILTSDLEETVTVNEPEKKKETPKPVKKNVPVVKTEPVKKPPVELVKVERKPDERALYPGKKGNSGSPSGTAAGSGTGGQGTGNGGGTGSGTGPGSGGGSGSGSGGGTGDGTGLYFDLGGRSMRLKPRIEENSQETGKVVIEIVVDKDGNVTTVNGPARGSTTSAPVLVTKAKQAAKEAKFSKSATGVEEQRGSITFVFKFE